MWYVEALMAFGTVTSVLGVAAGMIGLAKFKTPKFAGHILGGLVGFAVDAPAWFIVHQAIN